MMKKNKVKVIGSVVAFIVIGFMYCLFSHSGYKNYDNNESYNNLISVLKNISDSQEEAKISQADINIIGTSYLKSQEVSGDFKVEGINIDVDKEQISMKIPVKYKIFPLLLSTSGKVKITDNEVIYTPDYFKVGMFKVSNNMVFNNIKKYFSGKFQIKDSSLVLVKDKVFKDVEIVKLDKEALVIKGDNKTKNLIKKGENIINGVESKTQKGNVVGSNNSKNIAPSDNQNETSEKKASESHSNAEGKASEIISLANHTMSMVESNSNYNYWKDINKAKAIYDSLPAEEKAWVKERVINSVDLSRARAIKKKQGM